MENNKTGADSSRKKNEILQGEKHPCTSDWKIADFFTAE